MRKHFYCIAAIFCFMLSFFAWGSIQSDAAATYKINVENAVATVNGKTVTEAAAGDPVTLTANVPEGKTVAIYWEVYNKDFSFEVFETTVSSEQKTITFTMPGSDVEGAAAFASYYTEVNFIYEPKVGMTIESFNECSERDPLSNFFLGFEWEVSTDGENFTPVYSESTTHGNLKFEEGKYYRLLATGISDSRNVFAENCVYKINGTVCSKTEFSEAIWAAMEDNDVVATYGPLVAPTYNVAVENGSATVNGKAATNAKAGDVVTIKANSVAGKLFDGWSTSVTLANKKSETTTFTMPAADVTVEATYKTVSEGSSEQNKDTSTTESESASGSDVMDATDSELVDGATDTGVTDTGTIDGDSDSVNTGVSENGSDVVTNSSSAETGAASSSGQDNSDADSGKDGSDSGSSLIPEEEDGLSVGATVAIVGGSVGVVAVVAFVFRKSILALLRAIFRG